MGEWFKWVRRERETIAGEKNHSEHFSDVEGDESSGELRRGRMGRKEMRVGEVSGLRRTPAGEGGLSRQSDLPTTDKNEEPCVVAQSYLSL